MSSRKYKLDPGRVEKDSDDPPTQWEISFSSWHCVCSVDSPAQPCKGFKRTEFHPSASWDIGPVYKCPSCRVRQGKSLSRVCAITFCEFVGKK